MDNIIYDSKNLNVYEKIIWTILIVISILILYFLWSAGSNIYGYLIHVIIFLSYYFIAFKLGKRCVIYNDKVVFQSNLNKSKRDLIHIEDIDQIRFEDGFSYSYGVAIIDFEIRIDKIFLYVKDGVACNSDKNGKFEILVKASSDKEMVRILKYFKEKNIKMYVLTERQKVLDELNMSNWNNPQ